jgi:hypothetical protein
VLLALLVVFTGVLGRPSSSDEDPKPAAEPAEPEWVRVLREKITGPADTFIREFQERVRRMGPRPSLEHEQAEKVSLRGSIRLADGRPAGGATIEMLREDSIGRIVHLDTLRADREGMFQKEGAPTGLYKLGGMAGGSPWALSAPRTLSKAETSWNLVLGGRALVVRVTDQRAAPVARVLVKTEGMPDAAVTGGDGTVRFEHVEDGALKLVARVNDVSAEMRCWMSAELDSGQVTVVLPPFGTIVAEPGSVLCLQRPSGLPRFVAGGDDKSHGPVVHCLTGTWRVCDVGSGEAGTKEIIVRSGEITRWTPTRPGR